MSKCGHPGAVCVIGNYWECKVCDSPAVKTTRDPQVTVTLSGIPARISALPILDYRSAARPANRWRDGIPFYTMVEDDVRSLRVGAKRGGLICAAVDYDREVADWFEPATWAPYSRAYTSPQPSPAQFWDSPATLAHMNAALAAKTKEFKYTFTDGAYGDCTAYQCPHTGERKLTQRQRVYTEFTAPWDCTAHDAYNCAFNAAHRQLREIEAYVDAEVKRNSWRDATLQVLGGTLMHFPVDCDAGHPDRVTYQKHETEDSVVLRLRSFFVVLPA